MFYRVDYLFAVQIAGVLTGVLLGGCTARIATNRLARGYYFLVVALVVLRAGAFTAQLIASQGQPWSAVSGTLGDLTNFIFGLHYREISV